MSMKPKKEAQLAVLLHSALSDFAKELGTPPEDVDELIATAIKRDREAQLAQSDAESKEEPPTKP